MLNIVIITFIHSYNYGAFLQAKATEVLLSGLGYKPIFLNYYNSKEASQRKVLSFSRQYTLFYNIKHVLYKFWYGYYHGEIRNGKHNFQKLINELPKTIDYHGNSQSQIFNKIDVLICGSDQIWNPEICQNVIDPVYFGNIENVKKKISFASSFGSYTPNEYEEDFIKMYLSDFDNISVREDFAKDIISRILPEKKPAIVLDPTLCISAKAWKELIKDSLRDLNVNDSYALLYFVNPKVNCQVLVDYVKNVLNLKTIWVKNNNLKKLNVDKIINNATPYDFVSLISKAKFVITDSFHGTAFSINFNIDFVSVLNKKNPTRSRYLCGLLGLEERLVDESSSTCELGKIDYTSVNVKLSELREFSTVWLSDAISTS